ncbi:Homeobox-leucine zipper protein PROTODERMAL FACTOR 2 [Linum perenne]
MVVSRNETQLKIDADQSDAVQQFEVVVADVPNDVIQTNDVAGNQNDVVQDVEAASPASQNDVVQQSDSTITNLVEGQNAELIKSSDDESLEDDDDEDVDQNRGRKYQHHTGYQTTELESFFEECPHLNEKQMIHLSRKLGLEMKQIKFWFKNCRTEMKTQLEHHENTMLIRAKEKLQAENHFLREILADKTCVVCGNPVGPESLAFEYEELRAEKARLKKEICALTDKFDKLIAENAVLRKNVTQPMCTSCGGPVNPTSLAFENEQLRAKNTRLKEEVVIANRNPVGPVLGHNNNRNHNHNTTNNRNHAWFGNGAPTKTSRPVVLPSSVYNSEVYRQYVRRARTEVMSMSHMGEPLWVKKSDGEEALNLKYYPRVSAHGLMERKDTEFVTEATRASGIVCVDGLTLVGIMMNMDRWMEAFAGLVASGTKLDTLSSDGLLMVTWVEHVQYDESLVHPMMRPIVRSGMGFGARSVNHGWEEELNEAVPKNGERLLPEKLSPGIVGENVRIMSRKNSTDPDEAVGIVLSTSTSLWLPVSRRRVFEFLMREDTRKD